ncbi:hypothetical protein DF19_20650 [Streptomyces olindensis]|nr:hypothetical protein DF19_20650 [Streptomyces olindensis]
MPGVHAVPHQLPVLLIPLEGAGLLRRRVLDGALGGADAAAPGRVAGGELVGRLLVLRHDHVGRDADVRLVEDVGGLEEGPVAVHGLQHGGGADVVVRGEPQPPRARDLGALAPLLPRIRTSTSAPSPGTACASTPSGDR